MKKVVFEKQETINVLELNDKSFVGILFEEEKSAIAKDKNGFFGLTINTLDFVSRWHKESLLLYIKAFDAEAEFFVFDTKEELFNWLNS